MRKLTLLVLLACSTGIATAQTTKTELSDLIKKLITDSTGYENIGDWGVGKPKKFPVKWKADKIEMSPDTAINFFRMGAADITINGKTFTQGGQPVKWNVMLKGPRMGYGSFSIVSAPLSSDMSPKNNIDSIFGKKPFKAKLLKSCDAKTISGYYYYELKLPKKDIVYVKVSYVSVNGTAALRVDCYDSYSKYAAKLDCPK